MAAIVGLNSADVVIHPIGGADPITHTAVNIVGRNGRASLRTRGGGLVLERMGMLTAARVSRTGWQLTFSDGEVWDVERSATGCGCGGRGR